MTKKLINASLFVSRFFVGCLVLLSCTVQASPNSCSQWTDCNLALNSDINPVPERSTNFVYDQETAHFIFFQQTDSPYYGAYDPVSYQNMIDQVECGYRYLVCEVGLTAISATDKYHIYIGDHPSRASTSDDFLDQSEYFMAEPIAFDYTYTTMTHEMFHKIQFEHYGYTSYLNLNEGLASLVEQLPSEINFSTSLGKVGRSTAIDKPEYSGSYGQNIFFRYMFEQVQGPPLSLLDISSDWAVGAELSNFMDAIATLGPNHQLTEYLAEYLPSALNADSTVNSLDNLYDNFQVARYAFDYVDPFVQPRFGFQNKDVYLANLRDLSIYSTGNVIEVGTVLNFDNSNVLYDTFALDVGFQQFQAAEYHILEPNLATVTRLRVEKTLYDDFIRFQLIVKDDVTGRVHRKKILRGAMTSQTLTLPTNITISEMALVVYSVDENPVTTGNGTFFTMSIEGL